MTRLASLVVLSLTATPLECYAHGGGLDGNGGHMDRRTGTYHMHGGGTGESHLGGVFAPVDPMAARNAAAIARLAVASTAARASARKSPRTSARPPLVLTRTEPEYLFHHKTLSPYEVTSFKDDGTAWKALLSKGFEVGLPKDTIIRIEPINDPRDFRTWFDSSGKYSIVAKFVDFADPDVRLQEVNSVFHQLNAGQLSTYDQRHLYHRILHPERDPKK